MGDKRRGTGYWLPASSSAPSVSLLDSHWESPTVSCCSHVRYDTSAITKVLTGAACRQEDALKTREISTAHSLPASSAHPTHLFSPLLKCRKCSLPPNPRGRPSAGIRHVLPRPTPSSSDLISFPGRPGLSFLSEKKTGMCAPLLCPVRNVSDHPSSEEM